MNRRGFTIVELLIVIVVIGILAAITIVAYNGIQQRAKNNAITSTVVGYVKALSLYAADTGTYPGGATSTIACFDGATTCWSGADATKSTTLNTELKKVVSSLPSLSRSAFTWTSAAGYYIVFALVDLSDCPVIGGTSAGVTDIDTASGRRQCRVTLPNPS